MEYEDFELQIGPRSQEGVCVRVLRSPAGEGEALMQVPSGLEVSSGSFREVIPKAAANSSSPAEKGSLLFRFLFSGPVGDLFHQSVSRTGAGSPKRGLRIRLRINPRDRSLGSLHQLPWELLYREDTEDFLALSRQTPVIRSLDIPRPVSPGPFEPPLRILLVLSQDPCGAALNLTEELKQLSQILGNNRAVSLEILDSPDTRTLRRTLDQKRFHVLHYMGHGTFDRESGEGALLFRGSHSNRIAISGRHLATKVKDIGSLRLVVLNACNTAAASTGDGDNPFGGVATALVLGGVPAVVAMLAPIADTHAIAFSAAFYDRLAQGLCLEEAVAEGRHAIHSIHPEANDWAVPALFLRTASGDLFASNRSKFNRWRSWMGASAVVVVLLAASVAGWIRQLDGQVDSQVRSRETPQTPAISKAPSSHEPPPPQQKKQIPEKPEPKASGTEAVSGSITKPAQTATILPEDGTLRFEIIAGREIRSSLTASLRQAAQPLSRLAETSGGLSGWTVHLAVGAPSFENHTQEGYPWIACRISADCRLQTPSRSVDLGRVSAVESKADQTAACEAAADKLAKAVIQKIAVQWREE